MNALETPSGFVFDIKRFAVHDGPGIRTTVFFKGCPLGCAICHNPEGQEAEPELMYLENRCLGCGDCVRACPAGGLSLHEGTIVIDHARCRRCFACTAACPADALVQVGAAYTVGELLGEIERDRVFFDESGGGVTISGGEPFAQSNFLHAVLYACKERDLHTVVDTCGAVPAEAVQKSAPLVDFFLYDLKMMKRGKHVEFAGMDNAQIISNLRWLVDNEYDVQLRYPLIPGYNDGDDDLKELSAFITSLKRPPVVDILPYHKTGVHKYGQLQRPGRPKVFDVPEKRYVENRALLLVKDGVEVLIKGAPYGNDRTGANASQEKY